jgi:DNA-binding SARP family transcriptional activator/predicted ATPase
VPGGSLPDTGPVTEVRLLGPVQVFSDDGEVRLGGIKQQGVLTMLALATPRPVPVERLIDGIWADDPPPTARNTIQVYITGIRKALAPCGLRVERNGDSYALLGEGSVDGSQFESLVSQGVTALRTGRAGQAEVVLTAALALWRGRPLDGLDRLPFALAARAELEELRATAIVDLGESQLGAGRAADAARTAERVLSEHPYDERAWSVLIRGLYFAGRQDEALRTCRRVRRVLGDDLGVEPTSALTALEGQVLRHEVVPPQADAPPSDAEPPPALPSLPIPLVGRERLTDDLVDLVDRGVRVVTLTGLGGIGKTTLALAAAHRLRDGSQRPVAFCPLETETDAQSALARACRAVGLDPGTEPLASLSAFDGVLVLDNVEQVVGLSAAVDSLVSRHATPTMVVTSRRPLGCSGEHVVRVPGLPVASGGSGESSDAVRLFLGVAERVGASVDLAPGDDDIAALCSLLDGIPLAIELTAAHTRTVPPRQLLRRLGEGRDSALDGPSNASRPRQASLGVVLSDTIGGLTGPSARLLESMASFEGFVTLELLEDVAADHVRGHVLRALEDLVDVGLAEPDGAGRARLRIPVREFIQRHTVMEARDDAMVRGVVRLTAREGPRLTGKEMAEALERLLLDQDAVSVAVNRALNAGDAESVMSLVRHLQRFWLLGDRVPEGCRTLERALLLPGLSTEERGWLSVLAGTYESYFHGTTVLERLRAALEDATAFGLAPDRVHVNGWCTYASLQALSDRPREAATGHERARELAARSGDRTLVALVRDLESFIVSYAGDHERALELCLEAIAEARRQRDSNPHDLASLYMGTADNLAMLGRYEESVAMADEGLRIVADGHLAMAGVLLLMRGVALTMLGRIAEAEGCLLDCLRQAREGLSPPTSAGHAMFSLAACAASRGRDQLAARLYGAAATLHDDAGAAPETQLPEGLLRMKSGCCERLGENRFRTLHTIGAHSPDTVIDSVLTPAQPGLTAPGGG